MEADENLLFGVVARQVEYIEANAVEQQQHVLCAGDEVEQREHGRPRDVRLR